MADPTNLNGPASLILSFPDFHYGSRRVFFVMVENASKTGSDFRWFSPIGPFAAPAMSALAL